MKPLLSILLSILLFACQSKKQEVVHPHEEAIYTCPMHPEIIRNEPGACPICGMDLVLKIDDGKVISDSLGLNTLLNTDYQEVITKMPVATLEKAEYSSELEVFGNITYDTRSVGSIAARVGGRIEKLYVHYRYQPVQKGQKIMDIYSPELLTAQQNLLYLLKNDADNAALIQSSKDRLALLGFTPTQINTLIQTKSPVYAVSIFSNYSGYIQEAGSVEMADNKPAATDQMPALSTQPISIREGRYVDKGQTLFEVYNPNRAWILLNLFPADLAKVQVGNKVRIQPESAPDVDFRDEIDYIEPIVREGSTTATARIYLDNSKLKLPIGDRVRALIFAQPVAGWWLPETAVLSLGQRQVVFQKQGNNFHAVLIKIGVQTNSKIQIINGLVPTDSVAANAQYLIDSESFIKVKELVSQ